MLFLIYTKEKKREKESGFMLNEEICKLREELNNSIINGEDYEKTLKISVELDQLIAEYYRLEFNVGSRNKSVNTNAQKRKKKVIRKNKRGDILHMV